MFKYCQKNIVKISFSIIIPWYKRDTINEQSWIQIQTLKKLNGNASMVRIQYQSCNHTCCIWSQDSYALTDHSALCSSEASIHETVSGPELLQTKQFRQKGTLVMNLCWTEQPLSDCGLLFTQALFSFGPLCTNFLQSGPNSIILFKKSYPLFFTQSKYSIWYVLKT